MLSSEVHSFRNRELHIDWKEGETNDDVQSAKGAVQSANFALNLPLTLEKILSRGEGVWFSDFWMKFLCVFLLVYTVVIALWAYLGK